MSLNHFNVTTGETNLVLSRAILIYTREGAKSHHSDSNDALYATMHPIQNFGTNAKPNFQIAAGSPVTREGLTEMFSLLAKRHTLNTDLIPEHVLSISADHMVWWMPACERPVFFNNKELGKRGAKVPHPPLLFVVVQGQWSVYALAKNERPKAETELQFAPYFNVYDSGGICTGSAKIPGTISAASTASWEQAFFESEFTHINGSAKKSSHPRGEYALWKELLDGVHKEYPMQYLVPAKATVATLMTAVRKRLGAPT